MVSPVLISSGALHKLPHILSLTAPATHQLSRIRFLKAAATHQMPYMNALYLYTYIYSPRSLYQGSRKLEAIPYILQNTFNNLRDHLVNTPLDT